MRRVRRILCAIGGTLAGAAGALAVGNAVAETSRLAGQETDTFDPGRPPADPAASEQEAAAALAARPMDAAAVRRLVIARAAAGDAAGTAQALRIASALGWRDTPTQIILASQALAAGDMATAMQRGDALARRRVAPGQTLLLLHAVERAPGGAAALTDRLALSPLWRTPYLRNVASLDAADLAPREALYAALARGRAKPSDDEVAPFVARLIGSGDYARARAAWLRWGGHRGDGAAPLQDGRFAAIGMARGADPDGFGWRASTPLGTTLEREDDGTGSGALRVESDGSASGTLLSQIVLLAPGSHVFSVIRRDSSSAARDLFRWTVRCVAGGTMPIDMQIMGSPAAGSRMAGHIVVPPGCPAQMLTLTVRSADLSEPQTAWFDDAALSR